MGKNTHKKSSRRRPLVPEERRERIARLVEESGSVKVAMLEEKFGISPMTARRDLLALEREGRVQRTHGGAILPGFAGHEDSFQRRMGENVVAKERLARAAVGLVEAGEAVFIDSSTTAYHVAKRLFEKGLRVTILTNCVPVMELFSTNRAPRMGLVGTGGSLRRLTLSFVGPHAVRTVNAHFADKLFFSVKGVTPDGYLTDPDPLEAEVKRAMIERSEEPILLVDGSKFERRGLSAIAHASQLSRALVVDAPEEGIRALQEAGVEVRRV
ncbi:Lactose phosphotransferase system repressor [Rubrobacter xylanophilus DSM 9941]|nr:Lactose phosphotransferase system repressor [Rubrobacter xylanophilus DSM 9941]